MENGVDTYAMRLFHAAGDTLVFADESLRFLQTDYTTPKLVPLGRYNRKLWMTCWKKRRTLGVGFLHRNGPQGQKEYA